MGTAKKVKKITPIKSPTLCIDKCKYGYARNRCKEKSCRDCNVYNGKNCSCTDIKKDEPCPYFERAVRQKIYKAVKTFRLDNITKIYQGDLYSASELADDKVKLVPYDPILKSTWYIEATRKELQEYFQEAGEV